MASSWAQASGRPGLVTGHCSQLAAAATKQYNQHHGLSRAAPAAMTLDADNRTKTENFIRLVFKTFDVSSDGSVTAEEVARVLTALGRPQVEGQQSFQRNFTSYYNVQTQFD